MKLKISDSKWGFHSPTGVIPVRAYQIVLPISLQAKSTSGVFPAILDTGFTHNLALKEEQLRDWVRLNLKQRRSVVINGIAIPLMEAEANSIDGREAFLIDVNRRGRIKLTKCTYQER